MSGIARRVLVIGGGFSGMVAAIEFARAGHAVDLVEIDPDWRCYGAGISLNGATLRVLRRIGLLEEYLSLGAATDEVHLRGPDDAVIAAIPTPRVAGPEVPGAAGIMRPVLAGILSRAVRAAGVDVRLGTTFTAIEEAGPCVRVGFTDGSARDYDLVIGADGLYSATRRALFPEAPAPRYIGQSVWRALVPRPPEVETVTMWMGHRLKVGINHVSATQSYLFLTEDRPNNDRLPQEALLPTLRALLGQFPSPLIGRLRDGLSEDSLIVFRPIEQLLLPRPWHRGRVVLIGDTVHATTPHLAAGACLGIEDAVVLAEEVGRGASLEAALEAFGARRWERCRMVVENSGRLGEIEVTGGDREEHAAIMRASTLALAAPI